jgi:hypothetical protein
MKEKLGSMNFAVVTFAVDLQHWPESYLLNLDSALTRGRNGEDFLLPASPAPPLVFILRPRPASPRKKLSPPRPAFSRYFD